MADKKISALTTNPGIDGTEEMPTSKSGSNFKNTLTALKTWILSAISTPTLQQVTDTVNGNKTSNNIEVFDSGTPANKTIVTNTGVQVEDGSTNPVASLSNNGLAIGDGTNTNASINSSGDLTIKTISGLAGSDLVIRPSAGQKAIIDSESEIRFGDDSGTNGNTGISVNDTTGIIGIGQWSNNIIKVSMASSGLLEMGDTDGNYDGTLITVNQSTDKVTVSAMQGFEVDTTIMTGNPDNAAGKMKFGKKLTAGTVLPVDGTYWEIMIDGELFAVQLANATP